MVLIHLSLVAIALLCWKLNNQNKAYRAYFNNRKGFNFPLLLACVFIPVIIAKIFKDIHNETV